MEKREDRRDRSWRYGAKARREHLRVNHPSGNVDCVCDQSVWYFAKGKSLGCGCRKKKRGNPKLPGTGMCAGRDYRLSVTERISGRRLCLAWSRAAVLEDVEI